MNHDIPSVIRVIRTRAGHIFSIEVDGLPLALPIASGSVCTTINDDLPGITLTLVAERIEIIDQLNADANT